jgi:hypothetical protein
MRTDVHGAVDVRHRDAFRDLDDQRARRNAAGLQHPLDPFRKVQIAHQRSGYVDGDGEARVLLDQLAALRDRRRQHEIGELRHQAESFHHRNEGGGRHRAELGRTPARQRLGANDLARREFDLGLELDGELVALQAGEDPLARDVGWRSRALGGMAGTGRQVERKPELVQVERLAEAAHQ